MKYSLLTISLLLAYAKAKDTRYCWSEKLGFECCPDGTKDIYISDKEGDWGLVDGKKCGIREGRCWSMATNYPCCVEDMTVYIRDQDGEWGFENNNYCGIPHSKQKWVDREKIEDTKEEWNNFKTDWENYKLDFQRISVFPGDNETELNFAWYSTSTRTPAICWGTDEKLETCTKFKGTVENEYVVNNISYYSNKVTVKGLEPNSTYYYKRKLNGIYEDTIIRFDTYDPKNFKFIFVGDPQIGGSYKRVTTTNFYEKGLNVEEGTRNDAFNWNRTISTAYEMTGRQPSLLLSAGDQADEEDYKKRYNEEIEYSALLLPKQMQQMPMAAALGNHDNNFDTFTRHFNPPNPLKNPSYYNKDDGFGGYLSGYNYYFKYNNVLVVVLETNHDNCDDFKNIIVEGINKYPNTDWRIAMFHHDIYGDGVTHAHSDKIIQNYRACLTKLLNGYKFDLVINGHDHVYTASKFVSYRENAPNEGEYEISEIKENEVNHDPKGPLFITANCSTGAKLHEATNDLEQYPYVNKNQQTYTSTFGILDFGEMVNGRVSLEITTYEVENRNITDGPYKIEKQARCWSEPEFRCCSGENPIVRFSDEKGDWDIENGEWCGIYKKDEDVNIKKYKCWSYPKYKCCTPGTTIKSTDSDGKQWGIENGDWCGIVQEEEDVNNNNDDINNNIDNNKCWSEALGYSCCKETKKIEYTDKDGDWGLENDNWCGIIKDDTNDVNKCWSEALGYSCCKETKKIEYTDKDGDWGLENDNWCGIIKDDINDVNMCWSEKLGYKCCEQTTTIEYTDNEGDWGYENNDWCGIINNNGNQVKTTTTTTTKSKTTTTTTKSKTTTTTTTKSKTTTTKTTTKTTTTTTQTPEPSNCVPLWGQCGGYGYTGPTCCESGYHCLEYSASYSQCVNY